MKVFFLCHLMAEGEGQETKRLDPSLEYFQNGGGGALVSNCPPQHCCLEGYVSTAWLVGDTPAIATGFCGGGQDVTWALRADLTARIFPEAMGVA